MKNKLFITLGVIVFLTTAFTTSILWKADSKMSIINFELPEGGKKGTFSNLETSINFDKKSLADSKITASIAIKTIDAGDEKLNAHLLSADFFDAEKFPKSTFTSTKIKSTDTGFLATGTLKMKDSTKVIELPFNFTEIDKNRATFTGTINIFASDYGVMKKGKGKDAVVITLVVPVTK